MIFVCDILYLFIFNLNNSINHFYVTYVILEVIFISLKKYLRFKLPSNENSKLWPEVRWSLVYEFRKILTVDCTDGRPKLDDTWQTLEMLMDNKEHSFLARVGQTEKHAAAR
jgi:hypothetical protein